MAGIWQKTDPDRRAFSPTASQRFELTTAETIRLSLDENMAPVARLILAKPNRGGGIHIFRLIGRDFDRTNLGFFLGILMRCACGGEKGANAHDPRQTNPHQRLHKSALPFDHRSRDHAKLMNYSAFVDILGFSSLLRRLPRREKIGNPLIRLCFC